MEEVQTSSQSKWHRGRAESCGGSLTFMYIAFLPKEGISVEGKHTATFHTAAKVGDEHPVIYLPWHPENAKILSAKQLGLPLATGLSLSILGGFLGQLCLRNKRIFPTPTSLPG